MKVLIVHCGKGIYGGAEEVIVQLGKYLYKQGDEVTYILKNCPEEAWSKMKGSRLVLSDSYPFLRMNAREWLEWADVVNVHNFPATLAPFPTKKPIVWMCNEPAELFTNWWRKPIEAFNRWWVRKSGMKVVVADEMNAERFRKIYGVGPKIIPYGVDYEFWAEGINFREREDNKVKLLQVGTVDVYKQQMVSVGVLLSLLRDGFDATLDLAGKIVEGPHLAALLEVINEHKLNSKVFFLENLNHEQVKELYLDHDVLLHPVKGQGGWLVPFEAICAGIPVITTPSFSASSIIAKHDLGFVTTEFAQTTKEVLGRDWDDLTAWAKMWVKENLSWEKFGEGMVKVFEEAARR